MPMDEGPQAEGSTGSARTPRAAARQREAAEDGDAPGASFRSEAGRAPSHGASKSRPPTETTPLMPRIQQGASEQSLMGRASTMVRGVLASPDKALRSASDRIFQRERNSRFAEHAELAFRAGLYISLLMLPAKFGVGEAIWLPRLVEESRIISSEAMVQFIFTIYVTTGETTQRVRGGLLGNLIGTALPCCLFFFHPEGVTAKVPSSDPAFVAGGFLGSILVVLVLYLNLGVTAKIFALSTFVWHWMGFLNPGLRMSYSGGISLAWEGPLVQLTIPAVSGSMLALFCTAFPYPLLATDKACRSARKIVIMTGQTWVAATGFFVASVSACQLLSKVEHYLEQMNDEKRELEQHIANSWWECSWSARVQMRRSMLTVLDLAMTEACEHLTSVVVSCSIEDFGETHRIVMDQVCGTLEDVVTGAHDLLLRCTECACEGEAISAQTRVEIQDDIEKVRSSLVRLAREFKDAKAEAGLPKLSKELLAEHAFCLTASEYAHSAIRFGSFMCDPVFEHFEEPKPTAQLKAFLMGAADIFSHEHLTDKTHLYWTLKNSASVLACFWVGVYGFGMFVRPYEADIACTAALLLSTYSGSAMKRNLARLQGVVIGTIAGQFGLAMLGGCDIWHRTALTLVLGMWVTCTLFFYFDSATYGTITCLMAVFGVGFFVRPCMAVAEPLTGFHTVISTVIAIAVMTIVDMVFSMGRPSLKAHERMTEAWRLLQHHCGLVLDPLADEFVLDTSPIGAAISEAEEMGLEAVDEPRYWRTPWKAHTMREALLCARCTSMNLAILESGVSKRSHGMSRGAAAERDPLFQQLMMTPSFMELRRLNIRAVKKTRKSLDILVHEVEADFPFLCTDEGQEDLLGMVEASVAQAIESANGGFDWDTDQADLTSDPASRLSIVFMSVIGMNMGMRAFVKAAIRGN